MPVKTRFARQTLPFNLGIISPPESGDFEVVFIRAPVHYTKALKLRMDVGVTFNGRGVFCQDVGVPFKGVRVPSQVVRVPIQDLGVSFQGMGVFFQGVVVPI